MVVEETLETTLPGKREDLGLFDLGEQNTNLGQSSKEVVQWSGMVFTLQITAGNGGSPFHVLCIHQAGMGRIPNLVKYTLVLAGYFLW